MSNMKLVVLQSPSALISKLGDLAERQIPFAMAKSLTDTAKDYQAQAEQRANRIFTVRTSWNKARNKYGFRIRPATKSHWEARVFSMAPFIVEHEGAQTRQPEGRHFAVPTENVGVTRRGLTPKGQKPRNNPRLFKLGKGSKGLYQRKGGKLVRMYNLTDKAKLPKDLQFKSNAVVFVPRAFRKHFKRNLRMAIRTAK